MSVLQTTIVVHGVPRMYGSFRRAEPTHLLGKFPFFLGEVQRFSSSEEPDGAWRCRLHRGMRPSWGSDLFAPSPVIVSVGAPGRQLD